MGWTFLYLMVFLKLPILALGYLVWWAIHQTPDQDGGEEGGDDGGSRKPRHPRPPLRPLPRRGPRHASPRPATPARVRAISQSRRGAAH